MTAEDLPAQGGDEAQLLGRLVEELSRLPGVEAVAIGGSRAAGTHHPGSDWDFGVYYRGDGFKPADVRSLGYPGTVVELGDWGGGVFNGGGWLQIDNTKVDLLWRDLDVLDYEIAEAQAMAPGTADVPPHWHPDLHPAGGTRHQSRPVWGPTPA